MARRSSTLALVAVCLTIALSLPAAQAAGRSLFQDALSNSDGCLATIPKCEAGACATRNIQGVARWVCLRCSGNYEPVVTSDGQDNIVQCVCPKGFFEDASNPSTCTRCPSGSYCPGGDKVENPASRGANVTCGNNLVTRNTGARSQADCVAPAGYALTSPTQATVCANGTYAPAFNRLAKCLKCQSGLDEPSTSGLTDGQRSSKRAVCKIPPGRFMSQGLVRICPQGFYRQNWVQFDDAVGTLCLPCSPGVTTDGAGAGLPAQCSKVLPGYGLSNLNNVTNPATQVPALPQNASGLPTATLCPLGYYSYGGFCVVCPRGTVTTARGAKTVEECVVPPGYFLPAGQSMTTCAAGTFREGWLMASDPKAAACTPCGDGIGSEPRDLSENPLVANGTLVRATPSSCFVESGWGMIAQGPNMFIGRECPINTYGAAGKVYGLVSAPCKPCARNMITDSKTGVNNSDVCVNDDGFGYASEGASRCAPGFYSAKGSRKPCQQCPTGRTTSDVATAQRLVTDCFVKAGFGVVNSTRNSTDAFAISTTGLTAAQQAALAVLECPLGYFGAGNATAAKCQMCPTGSSTQQPGATSAADCSVCIPGWGKVTPASPCTICTPGTYSAGGTAGACTPCPSATYTSPVDGAGAPWPSAGLTTFPGATSEAMCVTAQSQLSPEAGQAYFGTSPAVQALLTTTAAADLGACITACPTNQCCLAQWDATGKSCKRATLAAVGADAAGPKLHYKLPPAAMSAASSLKAKSISSGIYARCAIPAAQFNAWLSVGSLLGSDARTFTKDTMANSWDTYIQDPQQCVQKCDDSNVCAGFILDSMDNTNWAYNATSGQYEPPTAGKKAAYYRCLYKGGEDALKTRSFFTVPTALDLSGLNWQGATAADLAVGNLLQVAASQGVALNKQTILNAIAQVQQESWDGSYWDVILVSMKLGLGS